MITPGLVDSRENSFTERETAIPKVKQPNSWVNQPEEHQLAAITDSRWTSTRFTLHHTWADIFPLALRAYRSLFMFLTSEASETCVANAPPKLDMKEMHMCGVS